MICFAAKLVGSVKSDRVCLALVFLRAHGETALDLLQLRPLKIQLDNPFGRKLLPPGTDLVVIAVSGQGSRMMIFLIILEVASSVENRYAAHRSSGPARLAKTPFLAQEQDLA